MSLVFRLVLGREQTVRFWCSISKSGLIQLSFIHQYKALRLTAIRKNEGRYGRLVKISLWIQKYLKFIICNTLSKFSEYAELALGRLVPLLHETQIGAVKPTNVGRDAW